MKNKPILCLDFDGVIHSYTSGWQGASVISDPPVPGAFEFIRKALDTFEVHIYSSRSHQLGGISAMRDWFLVYGWLDIGLLHFPTNKPSAFITIDDRAITFTGEWPDIETLKNFKPWNKK